MKKIKRRVSKYSTENDSLIGDYSIDHIPLSTLKEILNFESDDPEILKVRKIDNEQFLKLASLIPNWSKSAKTCTDVYP